MRNLDQVIATTTQCQSLTHQALSSSMPLTSDVQVLDKPVIVSFTTYSTRIHDVHLVIESLGLQTIKANRILLWLDEDEFSLETIPEILKIQMTRGLEVRFCPNYRSYKKLIPTLQVEPNAHVITTDDDLLYPHDFVELLIKEHQRSPNAIVGFRSHTMTFDDQKKLKPYKNWKREDSFNNNSSHTFLTTGAGTFFPARVLPEEMTNSDLFMTLSPSADDVWINLMAMKHGIQRKKLSDDRYFSSRFCHLPFGQDLALHKRNVGEGGNDAQANAIIEHFSLQFTSPL
ncbi:glycosyl transferase [Vibrio sp.]|nr:glycosyl transferase [Vibrio sp.]